MPSTSRHLQLLRLLKRNIGCCKDEELICFISLSIRSTAFDVELIVCPSRSVWVHSQKSRTAQEEDPKWRRGRQRAIVAMDLGGWPVGDVHAAIERTSTVRKRLELPISRHSSHGCSQDNWTFELLACKGKFGIRGRYSKSLCDPAVVHNGNTLLLRLSASAVVVALKRVENVST
jgi:hypothetical protein